MNGLTVDYEGRVFAIDNEGMPRPRSGFSVPLPSDNKLLILVNGFDYDPTQDGDDNPHQSLFPEWSNKVSDCVGTEWNCFGFGWYSAELEIQSTLAGLSRGYWNPYRWGWELAARAGGVLAKGIHERRKNSSAEISIIAHSLGARLVLSALGQLPRQSVNRVLLLNGAEYSQTSKIVASYTSSHVLNIVVRADDVLAKLATVFAPEAFIKAVVGRSGISNPPKTWANICFDEQPFSDRAEDAGYPDLRGDNPNNIADHWFSYKHDKNWKLFGHFLCGKLSIQQLKDMDNGNRNANEALA